jgi:nitric oxide dioxygenase
MVSPMIVIACILAILVITLALRWRHWPADGATTPTVENAFGAPRWTGWRRFKVRKRVDEDAAGRYCSFYLTPENRKRLPVFEPGQHIQVRVEAPDPEHPGRMRDCVRPYYLSDSPNGHYYRICVQRLARGEAETGKVSSYLLENLRKGAVVELQAPEGRCPFDLDAAMPLVLIGAGAGIAPLLAVCNTLIDRKSTRPVFVFYAMRDESELIFLPNFNYAASHLKDSTIQLCFSETMPTGTVDGATTGDGVIYRKGGLGAALLKKSVILAEPMYYLCGPGDALNHLASDLDALGVPPEQIHRAGFTE